MTAQKNNFKKERKRIYIFDTNIFLTGLDFNLIKGSIITTRSVIEEIEVEKYKDKNRNILNKIEAAIISKKLDLRTPNHKYLQIIEEKSKITGDYSALSRTDKELIALGLELKENLTENIFIYTNDYTMENLCSELNLPFSTSFNKQGIKKKIIWEIYCPFCKDIYEAEDLFKKCEKCGLKLKRRPKK